MSTTTVLFEDVDPFKDLHFPITFRAQIDFGSMHEWSAEVYEAEGAQGGWVEIDRHHALWPVIDNYVTSDAGYAAIEDQISSEITQSAGWDVAQGVGAHARAA